MTKQDKTPKDAAGLRQRAEALAREREARTGEDSADLSPEEIRNKLHELRVHQIELEMQNEELRTAQIELQAGRERYFELFDLAPIAYCNLSEKGIVLEANLAAATLLGTNRGKIIGQRISLFIYKEDQDLYYLYRKKILKTNKPQEVELRMVKSDGTVFWGHLRGAVSWVEGGGLASLVAISDISERKQAQEVLARQQRFIELSSRIANVFLISPRRNVYADVLDVLLGALDSQFGYFGYIDEVGDLVCPSMTRDIWDQCRVAEKSVVFPRASWGGLWGRSLMEKKTVLANEGLRIPEGHVALENALATPIVYKDDLIGQFVLANKPGGYDEESRDLLENAAAQTAPILFAIQEDARQKRAKEIIEEQMRQAKRLESLGRLAGGVAHDFNNMLGVILGHAKMILEDMSPEQPFNAKVVEIRKAAERSADLTRQLLAFARDQTVAPKVIDLNETVEGILKMLHRLIGEDAEVIWRPGEDLWPIKIEPAQIDQILANLCVNARDAIAGVGKITIATANAVFDEDYCKEHGAFLPGEYTQLTVSDDGCGMDAETLENVFEPFYTTKEWGKGTGLGLSSVYGAVKQNKGFVNIQSTLGKGTIFKIYLPRYRTQGDSSPEKQVSPTSEGGHETILVVEDEVAVLWMTKLMLERSGYEVLAADTPSQAIAIAQNFDREIHLLLTDVVMPEMNGLEVAKVLLSHYPNIKQLFMSGYTKNVIAHHGVLDEGVCFLQKPFEKRELLLKVRDALKQNSL